MNKKSQRKKRKRKEKRRAQDATVPIKKPKIQPPPVQKELSEDL